MDQYSHSNSESSQYYNDNNDNSVPTSYGPAANFTANDLGTQLYFNEQSMQRSDSPFSNTDSQDSALNGDYGALFMYRDSSQSSYNSTYSPLDVNSFSILYEPDINFSPSSAETYGGQPISNTGFPISSYSADWMTPRTEIAAPYQQPLVGSSVSPISPSVDSQGTQESQPAKYVCLMCTHTFARQADLKRHYDHKHSPVENLDKFYCDYKQCLRSESGYRLAQERMGQEALREKVSGIGPFTRKDHFKAHLREQHQEALPKRDPKNDPGWLEGKIVKEEWWRCVKCLKRVWIQKQRDEGQNEYTCCGCGTPCDQEVLIARQMKFYSVPALTSTSTSTSASSRRHNC